MGYHPQIGGRVCFGAEALPGYGLGPLRIKENERVSRHPPPAEVKDASPRWPILGVGGMPSEGI